MLFHKYSQKPCQSPRRYCTIIGVLFSSAVLGSPPGNEGETVGNHWRDKQTLWLPFDPSRSGHGSCRRLTEYQHTGTVETGTSPFHTTWSTFHVSHYHQCPFHVTRDTVFLRGIISAFRSFKIRVTYFLYTSSIVIAVPTRRQTTPPGHYDDSGRPSHTDISTTCSWGLTLWITPSLRTRRYSSSSPVRAIFLSLN